MKSFLYSFAVLVLALGARAQEESWRIVDIRPTLEAFRPVDASTILAPKTAPKTGTAVLGMAAPPTGPDDATIPEIVALAHALSDDALQIFNYVRNNITYEHYYGSKKGAVLTLLERSGNDYDQCSLLVALLKAAGLSPSYVTGIQTIPYADTASWLGLDTAAFPGMTWAQAYANWGYSQDPMPGSTFTEDQKKQLFAAFLFCSNRGWAEGQVILTPDGQINLLRTWVSVPVSGTEVIFDPSFKSTSATTRLDIALSSGYNRADLLTAVGGTSNASNTSIRGINETALGAHLAARAAQLRESIRASTQPHRSVEEMLGRSMTVRTQIAALPKTTLYPTSGVPSSATTIPGDVQVKLTVQLGGGLAVTRPFSTLGGECLALTFSGNTATLYLGDTVITTATVTGTTVNLRTTIAYPNSYGNSERILTYSKGNNSAYALIYAFSPNGLHLRQRQRLLDGYMRTAKTLSGTTYDVAGNLVLNSIPEANATLRRHLVTETLNVIGLGWAYHAELAARMMADQRGVDSVGCHLFGRAAQEQKNGMAAGYYVDLGQNCGTPLARNGRLEPRILLAKASSFFHSAMEHGEIEQMQSGTRAVSTVKLLALANRATVDSSRDEVFRVDSSNIATVRPLLTGYTLAFLDAMQTAVATQSAIYLLPENATNTLDAWSGNGYAVFKPLSIGMIISGGLSGGFSSTTTPLNSSFTQTVTSAPNYNTGGVGLLGGISVMPSFNTEVVTSGDPVDMNSGAFLIGVTDINLGESGTRGVALSRSYNSHRRDADPVGLGWGWTHSLDMRATVRSSPEAALGETTSFDAALLMVATQTVADLFEGSTAREWTVAALTAGWAVDQLKDNAVALTLGSDSLQFLRLPDGSYLPPAKSTLSLTKEAATGDFLLQERLGSTYRFAAAKKYFCTKISDFDRKDLSFVYSNDKLSTVTDGVGRSLTFNYTGSQLTSVMDNCTPARSVIYGVGTDRLLTSVTDVGNNPWHYDYGTTGSDAERRIIRTRDPQNRTIVENDYNAEGRVIKQRNQGLAVREYSLLYTGFANSEVGPLGGTTTYYYDSRGRALGVKDADGNLTERTYDGQDQVITSKTATKHTTSFSYDRNFNLIGVLDPLGAKTTNYYDTLNRLTRVEQIDPNYPDPAHPDPVTVDRATQYIFNAGNSTPRPDAVVDSRAVRTEFTYEPGSSAAAGKPTTVVRKSAAGDRMTGYFYDTRGLPQRIETPKLGGGVEKVQFVYNFRGDLESAVDACGFTSSFTYNNLRQILTKTGPGDAPDYSTAVWRKFYDLCGNLKMAVDPNNRATTSTISATGKVDQIEQGVFNGNVSAPDLLEAGRAVIAVNHYNRLDRLETSDGALTNQNTDFTYTPAGLLESVTDPIGRIVSTGYNADGQPETVTSPLVDTTTRTTQQQYNDRGQPTVTTDARSKPSTTTFNAWGERLSLKNRRDKTYSFTYWENGLPKDLKTPLSKTLTRTFNDRNLIYTVKQPSGTTATMGYDVADRIETVTDAVGQVTFTYNANGQPLTVVEGGASLIRMYDPYGHVKTYTDARSQTISYSFYANGLLKRLTYPGTPIRAVDYIYDEQNRLKTVTDWSNRPTSFFYRADGLLQKIVRPNNSTRELFYDLAGQLTKIEERKASGELHTFFSFGHDAGGRVEWRFELPRPAANAGEALAPMTYDDDNRVATWSGQVVTHDDDGNMTRGPLPSGVLADYIFDARNHLKSAGGESYSYDAEGNRVSLSNAAGTTRFVIDPNGGAMSRVLVRERPDTTKVLHVYAGNLLLYEVEASTDAPRYFHSDQVGNTVALSNAAGAITDRITYTPFGSIASRTGTSDTPFLFGGTLGCTTGSNGLVHMRARYYQPKLGRFVNQDPIGRSGRLSIPCRGRLFSCWVVGLLGS